MSTVENADHIRRLRKEHQELDAGAIEARNAANRKAKELAQAEAACPHDWDTRYDPIHHKGYTVPGDPPGTMGVDWQPSRYIPAHDVDRWIRICKRCGKIEETRRSQGEAPVKKTPLF